MITIVIIVLVGTTIHFALEARTVSTSGWESHQRILQLESQIRELRSRLPREELTESEIFEEECEAKTQALMKKYQEQGGAF